MGLMPNPPGRVAGGQILFDGEDITMPTPRVCASLRGAEISMIFQEPMTSLNPVFTAGDQIAEAIMLHQSAGKAEARTDGRRTAAHGRHSRARASRRDPIRTSFPAACASAS